MTTTVPPADPAALLAARVAMQRLTVQQKAQLLTELANEIAQAAVPAVAASVADATDTTDALDDLEQLINNARAAGPTGIDSADLISEMRR